MKKTKSRRAFIKNGMISGLTLPLLFSSLNACKSGKETQKEDAASATKNKPLKILILGGTSFLGPHQIAYAMERGHSISIFTRGKTQASIYKDPKSVLQREKSILEEWRAL